MNIAMLLDLAAQGFGDRVAVGSGPDSLTFDELRRCAAAGPAAPGVGEVRTLALVEANSAAVPITLFAAAWSGRSYAPLNYRLPTSTLASLVTRVRPALTICGSTHLDVLATGPSTVVPVERWITELRAARVAGDPSGTYPDDPEAPAVVLFTSGTTGAPKAAVLEHENLLAYILDTVEFGAAEPDDALLLAAPPFHIAGVAAVLSSVYAARRIVPLATFSPEAWLETARREAVTHAFVVPTMLARIVAVMDAEPGLRVPSLRSLSYGGARMPMPVLEAALGRFPETDFVNAYGLTETSSTIAVLGPEDHRQAVGSTDPLVRRRLGSVGRLLPSIEAEVVDEDGRPVPAGERGTIRLRGPQVGGRYLDSDGGPDDDGWLATGDVGSLDDDGYLYIHGRADDLIIKGGENLSPGEIEDALLRHPAVAAAAVVGIPDAEWGETIAVMVALVPGREVSVGELTEWVRDELGSLKTPSVLEVAEQLPMTDTGKVLRRAVRAHFGAPS